MVQPLPHRSRGISAAHNTVKTQTSNLILTVLPALSIRTNYPAGLVVSIIPVTAAISAAFATISTRNALIMAATIEWLELQVF
ncbi:MAG: hypothetical protein WA667_02750 [Candidatus Nitrosopolaris sp.]